MLIMDYKTREDFSTEKEWVNYCDSEGLCYQCGAKLDDDGTCTDPNCEMYEYPEEDENVDFDEDDEDMDDYDDENYDEDEEDFVIEDEEDEEENN